jgi:hypothetical protein
MTHCTVKNSSVAGLCSALQVLGDKDYSVDRGVWVNTNEYDVQRTRQFLQERGPRSNSVYVGVSGLFNWELIVIVRPRAALLIDHSRTVVTFMQNAIDALVCAVSLEDFGEILKEKISAGKIKGSPGRYIQDVDRWVCRMSDPSIFSEENFLYIKQLGARRLLIPLCVDFTDFERMQGIGDAIRDNGMEVSTLYMSNLCDWYDPCQRTLNLGMNRIQHSMSVLMTQRSVVIDATSRRNPKGTSGNYQYTHYAWNDALRTWYDPVAWRCDGVTCKTCSKYVKKAA